MNALDWLAVGAGPILLVLAMLPFILKKIRQHRLMLADRIDQLGNRLQEQLEEQNHESNQGDETAVAESILEVLRESESQPQALESSSQLSSIHPVQDSVIVLSERLTEIELHQDDQNSPQCLNLTSLVVVYIRSHLSEVISIDRIASVLGVSYSRLYNCLKECLGCSAKELVTVIRMHEAKKLLSRGDLLVKDVAARLGFWSPYHFSSRFKIHFGMSPRQFKKHYKNRRPNKKDETNPVRILRPTRKMSEEDRQTLNHTEEAKSHKTIESQGLTAGTAIDRFLIVEQIGRGGMGVVYKAYDPKLNRGVALKLIRSDLSNIGQSQNRLLREAQALARLSHPNVLHVYDVGTFGEQVFMTMALVEGQTLGEWLRERKRSIKEVLRVMIAAGRGLSAAHKAGLIHRDFKPGNVIVGKDGQVRVLDFGLARAISNEEYHGRSDRHPDDSESVQDFGEFASDDSSNLLLTPLTHAGRILGTPMYMAPEQHLGVKTDERTDQFGFCVVLYEALYGERPFLAKTLKGLNREVIGQQVCIPPADADVPAYLWQIIRRGLSAKPEDRYPSIDLLLEDLDKDPEEVRRQKRLTRRRRLGLASLILLTIALPVGVWYGLRYRTFQLCKNAQSELAGVWDDETKTLTKKAFLETKKSFALETWERVEGNIDHYLDKWMRMRSDVCEARLVRVTQSEELFDLRMSCLRKCIIEIGALVKVFATADAQVVQNAVQASSSLTDISLCANKEALRAAYPPPKNEKDKAKIAALREKFAEVEALSKTGKYREGLELAKKLKEETDAVSYQPVKAEALNWLGFLFYRTGKFKKAEKTLYEAAYAAGKSKDGQLVVKSMRTLLFVIGFIQGRPEDGLLIGRDAEIIVELVDVDNILRSKLLTQLGVLFWSKGDYDRALDYYRRSLEIIEKEPGVNQIYLAHPLNNMGLLFAVRGEYNEALACHRRALAIREKELGSNHPLVSESLHNLGTLFFNQGKYDKALKYFYKALTIMERAYGSQHSDIAWALSNIGNVFLAKGMPDEALQPFERGFSLCEKVGCQLEPHAKILFGLARTMEMRGENKERTIKLAKQARDVFGKTPKRFEKELKQVNSWLRKHGADKLTNKANK